MPQLNVIKDLSCQHASLCVQIGYWQKIIQPPNDKQQINHDLYMTPEWMFSGKNDCLKNEKVVLALNKGGVVINLEDPVGEMWHFHIFLIAMVQYAVTNNAPNTMTPSSWIFGPFQTALNLYLPGNAREKLLSITEKMVRGLSTDARELMQPTKNTPAEQGYGHPFIHYTNNKSLPPRIHKEVAKLFSFQSRHVGETSTFEYIVEVMMKLYLVKNIPNSYKDLSQYVQETYEKCLEIIYKFCDDDDMKKILAEDMIPAVPGFSVHQELSEELRRSVRDWFSGFVLVRSFGRRIATEYHKRMTSPKIESCELDWLKNSVHDTTSTFDVLQFVNECYKSTDVFDLVLVDSPFIPNPKQQNKIKNYNNLIDRRSKRIIFPSFIPLLQTLYGHFHITFEFQSRLSTNRFLWNVSPGKIREMNRENFTSFDRGTRAKFTRMLLHVYESTTSTNNEKLTRMYKTEDAHLQYETGRSVSQNGKPLGNFINEWFGPNEGHLVNIKYWFAYRNENMKKMRRSSEDTKNDENLSGFIKSYIDVNMQSSVSSLQPRVYIILKSLLDQKTFKTALYQIIDVICSDYAALIVPGARFATPEIGMDEMQYWEENKTFDFFIFTLIASLHSCTSNKSQPLTPKSKWLVTQRNVNEAVCPRNGKILCLCLRHFSKLFPSQESKNMCLNGTYSYSDILNCCLTTQKTTLKTNQYNIFRWKFINGETYSKKNIMEHTICVILRLLSVEVLHTDIEYTTVLPPAFPKDSLQSSSPEDSQPPSTDDPSRHASTQKHSLSSTSPLNDKKSLNYHESGDESTRGPIKNAGVLAFIQQILQRRS